jgi:hypothetical protein
MIVLKVTLILYTLVGTSGYADTQSNLRHAVRLALDQIFMLQVALYFSGYADTQSSSYFEIKATVS